MQVGDKAMLVGTYGWSGRLHVKPVTISRITPTGRISVQEMDHTYRPDGSLMGNPVTAWRNYRLKPWDEAIWAQFQKSEEDARLVNKLADLAEVLRRLTRERDNSEAVAVWHKLPADVQTLADKEVK